VLSSTRAIVMSCDADRRDVVTSPRSQMKPITVIGAALILLGVIALGYQGITYTSRETVIDLGPLHATADRQRTIPLSPLLGVVALAAGLVLVVGGLRGRQSGVLMLLLASTVVSTACASRTVNQIMADPARYRNRDVRLSGRVIDSYGVASRGAYRIDDGTGQLWVVSEQGVPRRNARVTLKGRVRDGFNIGLLGDRIKLPEAIEAGLVVIESSHKAKN
jgi:hypothetical protein